MPSVSEAETRFSESRSQFVNSPTLDFSGQENGSLRAVENLQTLVTAVTEWDSKLRETPVVNMVREAVSQGLS